MSQQIVAQVRSRYPTPLGAQHLAFLVDVARTLGLGLLKKTTGSHIPHPTAGGVSQDVVMRQDGAAWDILIDAEADARPAFNVIGLLDPQRYVAVDGAQPDPDPPSGDLEARIEALERDLSHLRHLLRSA